MNNFVFQSPTRFVFGRGTCDSIGIEVGRLGAQRVLLVYGSGSVVRTGTLGRVLKSLAEAGIDVVEFPGVRANPEVNQVRAGIELAREQAVDALVAVGGGSVIDCAKAIGFGYSYEGDVWDFFERKVAPTSCLPIACVLTIPAAGSEASSSCVISNDELGKKRGASGDVFRPTVAVMDPELTFTLPAYQTAAGVTDMIAHICERYFSSAGPVPVTDGICCSLIRTIIAAARRVMKDPNDYDARADIMWAGMLAHNDLAGCGRAAVSGGRAGGWESHALEHELSAYDPRITHGAGLAVIMPAWMRFVCRVNPERFASFGEEVFGAVAIERAVRSRLQVAQGDDNGAPTAIPRAEAAIDALAGFFAEIGMPSKLGELGLAPDVVDTLVEGLVASKGEVFGDFRRLGREDMREIYLSAF